MSKSIVDTENTINDDWNNFVDKCNVYRYKMVDDKLREATENFCKYITNRFKINDEWQEHIKKGFDITSKKSNDRPIRAEIFTWDHGNEDRSITNNIPYIVIVKKNRKALCEQIARYFGNRFYVTHQRVSAQKNVIFVQFKNKRQNKYIGRIDID